MNKTVSGLRLVLARFKNAWTDSARLSQRPVRNGTIFDAGKTVVSEAACFVPTTPPTRLFETAATLPLTIPDGSAGTNAPYTSPELMALKPGATLAGITQTTNLHAETIPAVGIISEVAPGEGETRYAGFWIRLLAMLVDELSVFILGITLIIVNVVVSWVALESGFWSPLGHIQMMDLSACYVLFGVTIALFAVIPWYYVALYESSKLQATPGKRMFFLKVVDARGRGIGFWRATYKLAVQTIVVFCMSVIWLGLGKLITDLVDSSVIRLVLWIGDMLLAPIFCCCLLFGGKQSLVDRISGRYVIHEPVAKSVDPSQRLGVFCQFATGLIAVLRWLIGHVLHFIGLIAFCALPYATAIAFSIGVSWHQVDKSVTGPLPADEITSRMREATCSLPNITRLYAQLFEYLGDLQVNVLHNYRAGFANYGNAAAADPPSSHITEKRMAALKNIVAVTSPRLFSSDALTGQDLRNSIADLEARSDALEQCNQLVVKHPDDPNKLMMRAVLLARRGNYQLALQDSMFARSMSFKPKYSDALTSYCLDKLGDYGQALVYATTYAKENPDDSDSSALLAMCLTDSGRPLTAEIFAAKSLQPDRLTAFALTANASVSNSLKDPHSALIYALQACQMDARYSDAWMQLAQAQYSLNNKTGALRSIRMCLSLSPENGAAHHLAGEIYGSMGRFDEAINERVHQSALGLCPPSTRSVYDSERGVQHEYKLFATPFTSWLRFNQHQP